MSLDDIQASSYQENSKLSDAELENDASQTEVKETSERERQIQGKGVDKEIIEKLDIKQKKENQDIQGALKKEAFFNEFKNLDKVQLKKTLGQVLSTDFVKIQELVKGGLISLEQGQKLRKQVLKKAFDKVVQQGTIKQSLTPNNLTKNVFEEFNENNPDFFSSEGRKEVLNYLKSGNVKLGRGDLNKISEIIRGIENSAIDRYMQKTAHEKNLASSNESAKQRLTANAQKSNFSGASSRTFTREQIGKMSGEQFAKYESIIMEQLRKGLIK